jgi:hypothetical protein
VTAPTVELLYVRPEDAEEMVIAWLAPLRRSGAEFRVGDPLPFTLVTMIAGREDPYLETAEPVVSVHTLCDRSLGHEAAKDETELTHRRMLLLGRHLETITLTDGRQVDIDYMQVFASPIWVDYQDVSILRKVGRYRLGLSYLPAPTQ